MPIPGYYKIHYTDPSERNGEGGFIVEPFSENGSRAPSSSIPSSLNSLGIETPIVFYGKGSPNYGDRTADDLLNILENFASPVPPSSPINGQLWYDTGDSFSVIDFPLNNTVLLTGDVVSEVQAVIDRGLNSPIGTPEQTTFRLVNVDYADDNPAIMNITPVSVSLQGINTLVTVDYSPFTPGSFLGSFFMIVGTNRKILNVYDKPNNKWTNVSNAYTGTEEPFSPTTGDLWVDTSNNPATFRYYDGVSFSTGFLSVDGGTMVGALLLFQDPIDNLEATTKQYVDNLVNSITGGSGVDLSQLVTAVTILEGQVSVLVVDVAALQVDVANLQATVGTLVSDVQGKYDKTGGVLTGNVDFPIPIGAFGNGLAFTSTTPTPTMKFNLGAESIILPTSPTTYEYYSDLVMLSENPGDKNSSFRIIHSDTASSVTPLEVRREGVLVSDGVYEIDPATIPMSDPLPATHKYVTAGNVEQEFTNRGLVLTDATFSQFSMLMELNTIDLGTALPSFTQSVDMSHTHPEISGSKITIEPYEPLYGEMDVILDNPERTATIEPALHALDAAKISATNPKVYDSISGYRQVDVTNVDSNTNTITMLESDVNGLNLTAGETVSLISNGVTGSNFIQWPGLSINSATLLVWDPVVIGVSQSANFIIDRTYTITVDFTPAIGDTVQDLMSSLSDQLNKVSDIPQPNPGVTISSSSNMIVVESLKPGSKSSVDIIDSGIFFNAFKGSSPSVLPIYGDVSVLSGEAASLLIPSTFNITAMAIASPNVTITVAESLVGLNVSVCRFVDIPTESQHLITKKYADGMSMEIDSGSLSQPATVPSSGANLDATYFISVVPGQRYQIEMQFGVSYSLLGTGTANLVELGVGASGSFPYTPADVVPITKVNVCGYYDRTPDAINGYFPPQSTMKLLSTVGVTDQLTGFDIAFTPNQASDEHLITLTVSGEFIGPTTGKFYPAMSDNSVALVPDGVFNGVQLVRATPF